MIKKIITVLAIPLASIIFSSCTENARTRTFGGTQTIQLDPGEELLEATWKDDSNLWLLVKLPSGKKEFREYSSWGIIEGKIVFETK